VRRKLNDTYQLSPQCWWYESTGKWNRYHK
jgi:hypothetical protein